VTDIRYVIVSDLHFGAENSVLTSLNERAASATDTGFSTDTQRPTPVLTGLVNGLRQLTREQDRPPTLILAGDILDLALSPDEASAMVFRLFAHLAFAEAPAVFDPVVHYVPGNHDHHEWEIARESQYVTYACAQPAQAPLIAPWHTTKLIASDERPAASSALLTGLTRVQAGGGTRIEFSVSYPNLALRTADGRRSLVISHGHFTESIYTLMSRLRGILYPGQGQEPPTDIERLEEENFAWIDFFWSTLGRSGQVGTDVGMIYADLVSPQDVDAFVYNLISALLANGKGRSWLHPVESRLLNGIFKREANRVARSERGNPAVTLSAAGQAGLQEYLEGPVRNQLRQEWGDVPEEFSFVYGHTHKPFTERRTVAGFPSAVSVANTGGWVVDTATPAPVQGGVAVLVNDDLETASLQFYRQGDGPVPVQFLPPPGGGQPSAWQSELESRVDPAAEPWVTLAREAAEITAQRHRLQAATVALRNMMRPGNTSRTGTMTSQGTIAR
jgi:Calcineurin-like phosphoesterase